jgi:hypothetical protein
VSRAAVCRHAAKCDIRRKNAHLLYDSEGIVAIRLVEGEAAWWGDGELSKWGQGQGALAGAPAATSTAAAYLSMMLQNYSGGSVQTVRDATVFFSGYRHMLKTLQLGQECQWETWGAYVQRVEHFKNARALGEGLGGERGEAGD